MPDLSTLFLDWIAPGLVGVVLLFFFFAYLETRIRSRAVWAVIGLVALVAALGALFGGSLRG